MKGLLSPFWKRFLDAVIAHPTLLDLFLECPSEAGDTCAPALQPPSLYDLDSKSKAVSPDVAANSYIAMRHSRSPIVDSIAFVFEDSIGPLCPVQLCHLPAPLI